MFPGRHEQMSAYLRQYYNRPRKHIHASVTGGSMSLLQLLVGPWVRGY